ncbi:hypothetical protein BKA70DRAFT_1431025 [Coprinopsis sp. MPI-PUGE-AT-0042]|nr:hypothetical protein BKA70DRAFT_1431025 [Coprinopsis sp. MPI-PUGE-AT-0042]
MRKAYQTTRSGIIVGSRRGAINGLSVILAIWYKSLITLILSIPISSFLPSQCTVHSLILKNPNQSIGPQPYIYMISSGIPPSNAAMFVIATAPAAPSSSNSSREVAALFGGIPVPHIQQPPQPSRSDDPPPPPQPSGSNDPLPPPPPSGSNDPPPPPPPSGSNDPPPPPPPSGSNDPPPPPPPSEGNDPSSSPTEELTPELTPNISVPTAVDPPPGVEFIKNEVKELARGIVVVAILNGQATSAYEVQDSVFRALSEPRILDLLHWQFPDHGIYLNNPAGPHRTWNTEFSPVDRERIEALIVRPLEEEIWEQTLRPFLLNIINFAITHLLTSDRLFPDLVTLKHLPRQLRQRLWWYAASGAYLHHYGWLSSPHAGIPYNCETEFHIHAEPPSPSPDRREPFVLHLCHGAVILLLRFIMALISSVDPDLLEASGNHTDLLKLAATVLSAMLYTAWERGSLHFTGNDVFNCAEADNLLHAKLSNLTFALDSLPNFMSAAEIVTFENTIAVPVIEELETPSMAGITPPFYRVAIPQPVNTFRLYRDGLFISYQDHRTLAIVHEHDRDGGPIELTPTARMTNAHVTPPRASCQVLPRPIPAAMDDDDEDYQQKQIPGRWNGRSRSQEDPSRGEEQYGCQQMRTNSNADGQPPRKKWFEEQADLEIDQYPRATIQQSQGSSSQSIAPQNHLDEDRDEPTSDGDGEQPEEGRGKRVKSVRHLLMRYRDFLPGQTTLALDSSLAELSENRTPAMPDVSTAVSALPSVEIPPQQTIYEAAHITKQNEFGLYKHYQSPELHPYDPEAFLHLGNFCNTPPQHKDPSHPDNYYPFPNRNAFFLGEWRASDDNGKSRAGFAKLLQIIGSPDWNPADICGVDWAKIDNALSSLATDNKDDAWVDESAWRTSTVTIGLRPEDHFHFLPHELRWNPGKGKVDVPVYGEMYNSPAFMQVFKDLQESPPEEGCSLLRYIVGLMFGSDETVLAQFGTAKLWPLYMSYANDSKYRRAKLGLRLVEHLAYLSQLPDGFKDFYLSHSGNGTLAAPLVTHCQRELFHEQWKTHLSHMVGPLLRWDFETFPPI